MLITNPGTSILVVSSTIRIPPKSSAEVPDDLAREFLARPGARLLGLSVEEDEDEDSEEISGMHWRAAIEAIQEIEDADRLEAIASNDSRARVRKAAEERLIAL